MAIYIDPPTWPAHGTVFSHLVSDLSLEELHAFASAAGIPERAFDRDHYDVAAKRYDDLVMRGAVPVSGRELVRRLVRSGLRVPARQRDEKLDRVLRQRWDALWLGVRSSGAAPIEGIAAVRERVLERWSEAHRNYHGRSHLLSVLRALDALRAEDPAGSHRLTTHLAAWFHDVVYEGVAGADEEASAALAETELAALLPATQVAEVARLVRLTAGHSPEAEDLAGQMLCDADLEVLARPWPQYRRYVDAVRLDYAHVSDRDFAAGRAQVLRHLLSLDPLFGTITGRALWQQAARENLRRELEGQG